MKTYEERFAYNITRLRKNRGLTQIQFANLFGYSEKTISKWECIGSIPSIETLYKVANVFNVKIDDLFKDNCTYLLGIDGGGTKTDFILSDENLNILNKVTLGGCNPIDIGIEEAKKILKEGIYKICENICLSDVIMFAGLSGGSSGGMKENLEKFFDTFGFKAFSNGSDTENIISAGIGDRDGIVVIMGTGNCAIAQHDDIRERVSGWGYLFDDGGSGYSIARDAIAAHFRYIDGSGEYTLFSEEISKQYPDPQILLGKLYKEGKKTIASYSPLVFECAEKNDILCINIIKKNMDFVADIIDTAAKKINKENVDVVLAGGISRIPMAISFMTSSLKNKYNISLLEESPVMGALICAKKIKEKSEGAINDNNRIKKQ